MGISGAFMGGGAENVLPSCRGWSCVHVVQVVECLSYWQWTAHTYVST